MSHSILQQSCAPVRQLHIGKPWVEKGDKYALQYCKVSLGETERTIYFQLETEFSDFLCFERGDAYLIGLLNLAMRERCDIFSDVPLTRELVHQIKTELIPALVKYAPQLYSPEIHAELADKPLVSAGKTGTGCSCGIDSLFAIKTLTDNQTSDYTIDYVTLNNVGAYTYAGVTSDARKVNNEMNAKAFCKQYGHKLIMTDSNFAEAFPQDHLKTHLYSSCFAIHMLCKLWGRYYYASAGGDMESFFQLTNNHLEDAARYDLIALPAFSTSQMRICNQGGTVTRFEKTKALAEFEPAQHHLNVCLTQGKGNCGRCSKCLRTLWALDAMGKLEEFRKVFDIDFYLNHRKRNIQLLYNNYLNGGDHHMNDTSWNILKSEINLTSKIYVRIRRLLSSIKRIALQSLMGSQQRKA